MTLPRRTISFPQLGLSLGCAIALIAVLRSESSYGADAQWKQILDQQARQAAAAAHYRYQTTSRFETSKRRHPGAGFVVVDSHDQPIAGATIRSFRDLSRRAGPDEEEVLGSTDAEGRLNLVSGTGHIFRNVGVDVSGHSPCFVGDVASGSHIRIVLAPSFRVTARAIDRDGNPVERVQLVMSQASLEGYLPSTSTRPGPIPTDSVHIGVSGPDGYIVVDGLERGRYDYLVLHPSMAWIEPSSVFPKPGLEVPTEPMTLVMSGMQGCYKRVVGARVLAQKYKLVKSRRNNWHWDRVTRSIQSDFATVLAVTDGTSPQQGLTAMLFLEDEGWREFRWPFAPYSIHDPPEELIVRAIPHSSIESATGTVRIAIRDRAGRLLPLSRMGLRAADGSYFIPIEHDREQRVPCGQYVLTTNEAFVGLLSRHRVNIGPDDEIVVDETSDLAACRWSITLPTGRQLAGSAAAKVVAAGFPDQVLLIASGGVNLLPIGRVQIEVAAQTSRSEVIQFQVVPTTEAPEVITCLLQ